MIAVLGATLGGCSLGNDDSRPPALGAKSSDKNAAKDLGFPSSATKNTTRVGGGDATADAAGVASLVFPGTNEAARPNAVVLVDKDDWQGAVSASVLAATPIGAPLLVSDGKKLPPVTEDTIKALKPKGSDLSKGAQVIRIGDGVASADNEKNAVIPGKDPYARAAAIDRFFSAARAKPSADVMVVSGEQAEFAMPAAAWAARSGDSVLLTRKNAVPAPTLKALREHQKPNIYVVGPTSVVSAKVQKQLAKLGTVHRVQGKTPVANAIAFARYQDDKFGWGIAAPGYNFTLASTSRPLDAAASSALATNGIFAPLLLTDGADLPKQLEDYFLNVQPGYDNGDPRQAVYNHVWILGDDKTVSVDAQARLDQITQLIPVQNQNP